MSEVQDRLRATIVKALRRDIPATSIVGNDLVDELGVTSVDALEILILVEHEFGITIQDEDLSQELVASLANLESYVQDRISAAG